jgi:hypothetical protein
MNSMHTLSLTAELLLALASTVILGSESHVTCDHTLPSDGSGSLQTPVVLCHNSESESYVTTDGVSASLSWNKEPNWGLRPDFYYCQTVASLLTGLSFTIAAGPRQRSHSRVPVLWNSLPYFTVSESRIPFSSPPTTRRATVEVFTTYVASARTALKTPLLTVPAWLRAHAA